MRALKTMRIAAYGRESTCETLLTPGSGITAIQRKLYEREFERRWLKLDRPTKVFRLNRRELR